LHNKPLLVKPFGNPDPVKLKDPLDDIQIDEPRPGKNNGPFNDGPSVASDHGIPSAVIAV